MSGITPRGQLFTLTRRRPLRSVESIAFLGHVQRMVGRKLLVLWHGSPIHRSNESKSLLAQGGAPGVQLEKLPAYAPDLNPDEGVWQHLKHVEMRNLCCTDLYHLAVGLNLAVRRLRKKPSLLQSFFAGAGLDI